MGTEIKNPVPGSFDSPGGPTLPPSEAMTGGTIFHYGPLVKKRLKPSLNCGIYVVLRHAHQLLYPCSGSMSRNKYMTVD